MSFFSVLLSRSSVYALGIVATAFVVDRVSEISSEYVWKTANKGVSIQDQLTIFHEILFN